MESLNSLKVRWEQKFKTRNPALKSVTGRPSTPFRPRISFLPRRIIRTGTDPLPDPIVEHPIFLLGELQEAAIPQDCEDLAQLGDLEESAVKESRATASSSPLVSKSPPTAQEDQPEQPVIYVDRRRRWLTVVPRMAVYSSGLFSWTEAVLPAAGIICSRELEGVTACVCNIQWFLFLSILYQVCHGGGHRGWPLAVPGQPIVLQVWEQGMSLRRQQHTQIPVWIRLKHLPMEYWTDEGLSTVASGVGTPLYTDGITKECSRLDYAGLCYVRF
ncbi:UNVERIFIED_CONTAM: hypothetical protein Scaly_3104300 [Sesamum calycinum]|uniref:DUF4283 domain-containing protein n=1 Tax=Sesamum calycinum TaxID=2727403 RepID=A0AAW2JP94_9LAMI